MLVITFGSCLSSAWTLFPQKTVNRISKCWTNSTSIRKKQKYTISITPFRDTRCALISGVSVYFKVIITRDLLNVDFFWPIGSGSGVKNAGFKDKLSAILCI